MTVLSVPGGKGRGPIEGEGPEKATATPNNVGPMTAEETTFFNRVKDWLGVGVNERVLMQVVKYSEIEIALTNLVRSWIEREDFRTLAVCQFLPINGRTLWLTRNQLRLKGLEFRNYGNRIMRKVFEGTPLEALNVLFVGSNCTLFGKDINAIQTVVTECDKIAWIVPLAIVHGCRILSMAEARDLCKRKSFEEHRAETLGTISQIGRDMVSLMGQHLNDLTRTLDQIALRNEPKE
uniref:Large ribosomal subunit protein uL10m n=1 Tax=Ascaris lumbricoides TaxID=6252 RepID=A0A0M3IPA6_ASCLU